MKSIQSKFLALILSCVLLCAVVIGGAGIVNAKRAVEDSSAQSMNLQCSQKATELNALLSRIEQSVKTLAVYSLDQLESVERLKTDPAYVEEYTRMLEQVAINAADNTEGALAVYVRFNPDWTEPTSGLFWSKTVLNGSFQQLTPTDFSSFSPDDMEHVGWYYQPVKSGKAVWMSPYLNQNINVQMISYVIPLYMNNQTVGVVGMDIDYEVITNHVEAMQVYESGYAFLTDNAGRVMHHKSLPMGSEMVSVDTQLQPVVDELENGTSGNALFGYRWKGEARKMAFRSLMNGMRLALTAPVSEINATRDTLMLQILVSVLGISVISVLLTVTMTRKLIRPLKELNTAAQKIAAGDLSISLSHQTRDEVGTLADSFQQTVSHLQKYIDYINGLAYRDSLTGVKNKTAYQEAVQRMEDRMRVGRPEFAVAAFDINDLKQVNDSFGHDFGDMLIIDCCKLLCQSFKHSAVYRVGGDEFAIILEGDDFAHYAVLLDQLENLIEERNRSCRTDSRISIARGISIYSPETDLVFANVFKRADDAMYQNKAVMKGRPPQVRSEESAESKKQGE